VPEFDAQTLVAIGAIALLAGFIQGITGMAGGLLLAAFLSHVIGIKLAVPAITVALLFSNTSRAILYREHVEWPIVARVLLFGLPMVVLGVNIFVLIDPTTIAILFTSFLILSIPIKHWTRHHKIRTGPILLSIAGMIWGLLAGNVLGPGFFLAPFLLGAGLGRHAFIGTFAFIFLGTNIVRSLAFGATGLLDPELLLMGVGIGLLTIPGNWYGRRVIQKMQDAEHHRLIDVMTVLFVVNFAYLAFTTVP
jgi:uncharacterized membrane protein YfcA